MNLRRQHNNKQGLSINVYIDIQQDLKEYEHSFSRMTYIAMNHLTGTQATNTVMIHVHNINNMLLYATKKSYLNLFSRI